MNKILEKADSLYFQGKPTGLLDEEYDRLAEKSGHLCKPSNNAWAMFPDCDLLEQNYGLARVSWDVAKDAVKYWPKYDGIFLQVFRDSEGFFHAVTRGNGRKGKDIALLLDVLSLRDLLRYAKHQWRGFVNCELCYRKEDGGRVALCRDLSQGYIADRYIIADHEQPTFYARPRREIDSDYNLYPLDGWVVELSDGLRYKYKG